MHKVLPACEISNHTWVFAASATDVAFELRVTDNYTGLQQVYNKDDFDPAGAITDTSAFANCD